MERWKAVIPTSEKKTSKCQSSSVHFKCIEFKNGIWLATDDYKISLYEGLAGSKKFGREPELGLYSALHKLEKVNCSPQRIRGDGVYWG